MIRIVTRNLRVPEQNIRSEKSHVRTFFLQARARVPVIFQKTQRQGTSLPSCRQLPYAKARKKMEILLPAVKPHILPRLTYLQTNTPEIKAPLIIAIPY